MQSHTALFAQIKNEKCLFNELPKVIKKLSELESPKSELSVLELMTDKGRHIYLGEVCNVVLLDNGTRLTLSSELKQAIMELLESLHEKKLDIESAEKTLKQLPGDVRFFHAYVDLKIKKIEHLGENEFSCTFTGSTNNDLVALVFKIVGTKAKFHGYRLDED